MDLSYHWSEISLVQFWCDAIIPYPLHYVLQVPLLCMYLFPLSPVEKLGIAVIGSLWERIFGCRIRTH